MSYVAAYGLSQQKGFNQAGWNQAVQNDQALRQAIPGYSYNQPTPPQQTLQDRVFAEHEKAKQAYNAEAEGRYNEAKGLYQNLLSQPTTAPMATQQAAAPNYLDQVGATLGMNGQQTGGTALGISQNKWGAGDMAASSPLWGPQAAAAIDRYNRSGLGDSTFGQNQAILSNSMDLAGLRQREVDNQFRYAQAAYGQAQDQRNFGYNAYQDQLQRTDQLTDKLANTIASKTPTPPPDITEIARQYGLGNTANSVGGAVAGGGYGGGGAVFANNAYSMPNQAWGLGGSFYSPQKTSKPLNRDAVERVRVAQKQYDNRKYYAQGNQPVLI